MIEKRGCVIRLEVIPWKFSCMVHVIAIDFSRNVKKTEVAVNEGNSSYIYHVIA